MSRTDLDEDRLNEFERLLVDGSSVRVGPQQLWRALAVAFPHRSPGPAERQLLLDALAALAARGTIRLPSATGARWDRAITPAVPKSIDVVRDPSAPSGLPWRTFPWHPSLHWVSECRSLSAQQVEFLGRVHDGLVHGAFRDPAPFKYRSLQLTGDEKLLASLATTSLFGPSRLTLDLLGCLPDVLPLAWEAVGAGGRMVIFENAGPFVVAMRVLAGLQDRPYDLVAYGGGRSILASLRHLVTLETRVESIHYVGDLDYAGLDIAASARRCAKDLGLPELRTATEVHRQMLDAAEAFGHREGWPAQSRSTELKRSGVLDILAPDLRGRVNTILAAGRRIPEEVLGPTELRDAWSR